MLLAPEITSTSCGDVMITLPVTLPVTIPVMLTVTLPITLSHTLTWSVSAQITIIPDVYLRQISVTNFLLLYFIYFFYFLNTEGTISIKISTIYKRRKK